MTVTRTLPCSRSTSAPSALLYTPYAAASTPSSVKLVAEVTTPTVSSRPSSSTTDGIEINIIRSPATMPCGNDVVRRASSPLVRLSTLATPPPVVAHGDSAASRAVEAQRHGRDASRRARLQGDGRVFVAAECQRLGKRARKRRALPARGREDAHARDGLARVGRAARRRQREGRVAVGERGTERDGRAARERRQQAVAGFLQQDGGRIGRDAQEVERGLGRAGCEYPDRAPRRGLERGLDGVDDAQRRCTHASPVVAVGEEHGDPRAARPYGQVEVAARRRTAPRPTCRTRWARARRARTGRTRPCWTRATRTRGSTSRRRPRGTRRRRPRGPSLPGRTRAARERSRRPTPGAARRRTARAAARCRGARRPRGRATPQSARRARRPRRRAPQAEAVAWEVAWEESDGSSIATHEVARSSIAK